MVKHREPFKFGNTVFRESIMKRAEAAWDEDAITNLHPVNPFAFRYGYVYGFEECLQRLGQLGIIKSLDEIREML